MSKKKKTDEKDSLIHNNNIYIKKLEQTLANQAITIARLETNIELMEGAK